jgi:hypothetical protein
MLDCWSRASSETLERRAQLRLKIPAIDLIWRGRVRKFAGGPLYWLYLAESRQSAIDNPAHTASKTQLPEPVVLGTQYCHQEVPTAEVAFRQRILVQAVKRDGQ